MDRRLGLRHDRRRARPRPRSASPPRSASCVGDPDLEIEIDSPRRPGTSTRPTPPVLRRARVLRRRRRAPPSAVAAGWAPTPPSRTRSTSPGSSPTSSGAGPARAAGLLLRRAGPGRRADRRPRQPVPGRLRARSTSASTPTTRPTRSPPAWRSCATPAPRASPSAHALHEALELKNYEFNAQGVELNQRYTSTAVVPDATPGRGVASATRSSTCRPPPGPAPSSPTPGWSTRAGAASRPSTSPARAGSRWSPASPDTAWVAAVRKLDLPFLRRRRRRRPRAPRTPTAGGTASARSHEAGAVLVRPDGFVAWRYIEAQWDDDDAQAALETALHRVLSTTLSESSQDSTPRDPRPPRNNRRHPHPSAPEDPPDRTISVGQGRPQAVSCTGASSRST